MDFCCAGRFVNCQSSGRPEIPFYGLQTVRHSLDCPNDQGEPLVPGKGFGAAVSVAMLSEYVERSPVDWVTVEKARGEAILSTLTTNESEEAESGCPGLPVGIAPLGA